MSTAEAETKAPFITVEMEETETKTQITPKKGGGRGRKKKQISPEDAAIVESMGTDEPSLARGKPKRTIKAPKTVYEPADPRLTRKRRGSASSENGTEEQKPKRARKTKKAETGTEVEEGEVVKPQEETTGEKTAAAAATTTGEKMDVTDGEKEKTGVVGEKSAETKEEDKQEKDVKSTADSMQYEGGSNQEHMKSVPEMITATVTTCESNVTGGKDESVTMTTTVPVEEGTTTTSTST